MMKIEMPYPPSVNHYYQRAGPRTLISRKGRAFRMEVETILAAVGFRPFTGRLDVRVIAHPPDRRRCGVGNVQEVLLDVLEHAGVYGDDNQIIKLAIEKREPVPGGRTIVEIRNAC